uniref:C2H2-type domain-containing protein n=1 Tax=Anopheles farauti TaxID=69004 RepID=A0A182QCN5_9DIPT
MCSKSLSCILCGQPNFPSIDALRVSLLKVTARPLKCPICGDELHGLDKLTIHLFGHSLLEDQQNDPIPSDGVFKNDTIPNTTFATGSFKTLRKVRKKTPLETEVKQLNGSDNRAASKMSPAVENSQSSTNANHCSECDVVFRNSALLNMHREVFHDSGNSATSATNNTAPSKHFYCHICPKEFKMKGSLKIHMRVVHEAGPKKRCLDNAASVCAPEQPVDTQMIPNARLATSEMPYTCGICHKSFTFQQSYHKHLLYHSDEKPHVCTVCNRAFKELSTLHNHQRIHSGEKPFACETCGKCFRQRVSYLVHRRIHTGLMPYKCSGCDKSFRYKVSQRTHKCPASPPGTVVRKTGDLLQKLLQTSSILPEASVSSTEHQKGTLFMDDTPCAANTEATEDEDKQTADYVNRTLDELVKGTYDKLDIGGAAAAAAAASSLLYDQHLQPTQLYTDPEMVSNQPLQPLSEQPQSHPSPQQEVNETPSFPRIESLCLLSPSAFDGAQLEDLEGLKLDNGW